MITFAYDGAQQRIKKTTPTRETIYVGGIYERVTDAGAGTEHRFDVDVGSATVVIAQTPGHKAEKTFVHKDLLGSARREHERPGDRSSSSDRGGAWRRPKASKLRRSFTSLNMRGPDLPTVQKEKEPCWHASK